MARKTPTVTITDGTASVHLQCLDETAAKIVATELRRPGDKFHNVTRRGSKVRITFRDLRWPMDVAEWAFENDHAHDDDASAVIVAVQGPATIRR